MEGLRLAIGCRRVTTSSMTSARVRKGRKRTHAGGRGRHRHLAAGTRAVAMVEAAKGGLVVVVGLGLFALIHRNVQAVAEEIVRHVHLNPASRFPRIFLDAAASASDSRLWALAVAAMVYAMIRFVEAYGLWREQVWAEWFGILSGSLYLPLEVYELTVSVSAVKVILLVVNLVIVGWLAFVRWQASD